MLRWNSSPSGIWTSRTCTMSSTCTCTLDAGVRHRGVILGPLLVFCSTLICTDSALLSFPHPNLKHGLSLFYTHSDLEVLLGTSSGSLSSHQSGTREDWCLEWGDLVWGCRPEASDFFLVPPSGSLAFPQGHAAVFPIHLHSDFIL